jgi:CxxC-x17-CxxC domain-containing protein
MNDFRNNGTPRPMVEGSWTCSGCGNEITKLPFVPREDRLDSLKCVDCFRASRPERPDRGNRGERQMFEGSWTCADCGKEITKMPFEPKGDRPIKCLDCFRSSR